jgi:hypothetical protein
VQPGSWCFAVPPYLLFSALAYFYRRRVLVSLLIFGTNLILILLAVPGWYEGLQPVGPNAPPYPRGLGPEMAPLVQLALFVLLVAVISCFDTICRWWARRGMSSPER